MKEIILGQEVTNCLTNEHKIWYASQSRIIEFNKYADEQALAKKPSYLIVDKTVFIR